MGLITIQSMYIDFDVLIYLLANASIVLRSYESNCVSEMVD